MTYSLLHQLWEGRKNFVFSFRMFFYLGEFNRYHVMSLDGNKVEINCLINDSKQQIHKLEATMHEIANRVGN